MPTTPNYTLTGKILSLTGAADQGYAILELVNFSGIPTVAGNSLTARIFYQANCDNTGAFSVTPWGNDQLVQSDSYYMITLVSADNSQSNSVGYKLEGGG